MTDAELDAEARALCELVLSCCEGQEERIRHRDKLLVNALTAQFRMVLGRIQAAEDRVAMLRLTHVPRDDYHDL